MKAELKAKWVWYVAQAANGVNSSMSDRNTANIEYRLVGNVDPEYDKNFVSSMNPKDTGELPIVRMMKYE